MILWSGIHAITEAVSAYRILSLAQHCKTSMINFGPIAKRKSLRRLISSLFENSQHAGIRMPLLLKDCMYPNIRLGKSFVDIIGHISPSVAIVPSRSFP
mgnify:CR=1 FL=1